MGELRLPGLATGIDTAALIDQLMKVNSRRLASYQVKKTGFDAQVTALSELRAKVNAMNSASSKLSDASSLKVFSASSSNKDVLTVSATSEANPGSHSIEIDQLATTENWIQDASSFNYTTDYVGGGNFIYSYNHQERVITAVAGETTLEEFVGLINNDQSNPGVTASLLHQGGKYHLMLSGQQTGEDYQISINTSNTQVWESASSLTDGSENVGLTTKITALDSFSGTLGDEDNAYISIGGTRSDGTTFTTNLSVTEETTVGYIIDEINSRFEVDGVRAATATLVDGKIRLTDNTCGESTLVLNTLTFNAGSGSTSLTDITIDESADGGSVSESLSSIMSTSFTQTQDAQNSQIKINDYTPSQVAEIQTLSTDAAATGGTFTLSYGGQTTDPIDYDADLSEIKAALELLSTIDTITVGGDKLDSGASNMTFTFPGSEGNVGLISINSSLTGTDGQETIVETTKGNDSQWISRNSNIISDALTGITLNLHDVNRTDDSDDPIPVKITISRNIGQVSNNIQNMVTAYNELIGELKSKTEYNAETKKMGKLSNDMGASFLKSQIETSFIGMISGFSDTIDSFVQASDIGITIDGDGMMEFDKNIFSSAVAEDFDGALEVLGATKSGNSSSSVVGFYSASDKYTKAGAYNVEVDISDNAITGVRIKLSGESTWRTSATWSGNLITGDSTFDEGNPLYAENGLQFTADLSQADGTYSATVRVKQGVAGALEDLLTHTLESDGRLDTSQSILDDKITAMARTIENEENRLNGVQQRLIDKYARLEKTLSMMQQQMGAVSAMGIS